MIKHRHSSFLGEILQHIPLLHFEMLAGLLTDVLLIIKSLYTISGLCLFFEEPDKPSSVEPVSEAGLSPVPRPAFPEFVTVLVYFPSRSLL